MKEQFNKAVAYVKTNPVKVVAITAGVVITGFVIYKGLEYGAVSGELGEIVEAVESVEEVVQAAA